MCVIERERSWPNDGMVSARFSVRTEGGTRGVEGEGDRKWRLKDRESFVCVCVIEDREEVNKKDRDA